MPYRQQ